MRSIIRNLSLATVLSAALICGFVQASNEFALWGDEKINWSQVNPFDTLEEMLVRELADYGNPEKDFELAQMIINDKFAKVRRGEADMSDRLKNERDAISAIRHLKTLPGPDQFPCDQYSIGLSQMKADSRPIVNKWLDYFGGRVIGNCRNELKAKVESIYKDVEQPESVIAKLPASELEQLIPGDSGVPAENWTKLMNLITKTNNSKELSVSEINIHCARFNRVIAEQTMIVKLISELKSLAPEEFSDFIELPKVEASKQQQILCAETNEREGPILK